MRKFASIVLSAAMVMALATGCSSSSDSANTADTTAAAAAEAGDAAEADTEAAEDAETAGAEGVMPAIAKEDLKIGVIHITDPAEGSGYT